MKKLKRFENFDMSRRIGTPEYEQSVKDSYSALEKREQVVQSIVDEMTPKPEIICEEIMDIFESWKDEGVEFENIELVTLKDTGGELSVYYPLGWSGRSGKKYYHPSFGNTNVYLGSSFAGNNVFPTFKMEMYKSQNEGFILNLIKTNPESHIDEGKLFILNDIENLGRDIQYILAMEILKK